MKTLLTFLLLASNTYAAVTVWDFLNYADDLWEMNQIEEVEPAPSVASFTA